MVTEGAVIYQARALYNVINRCVQIFNDNCPNEISNSRLSNNSSSVNSINEWSANIYPNPASEELYINTNKENEDVQVKITDVNGKLIANYDLKTEAHIGQIKLYMKNGVYFVTLTNQQNNYVVKKLIITK